MANILVVHYSPAPLLRATGRDNLYSFHKYSGCNCFYLNLALRRVPRYLKHISFDLIVFSQCFLEARWWKKEDARRALARARRLKPLRGVKIALPQDEFVNTAWLCDFINEFEIDYVFSVAPEPEWPLIYPTVDPRRVRFVRVLTGYLDDATLGRIAELSRGVTDRPITLGYRTAVLPWWGRFGWCKQRLADVFDERARSRGLRVDISTRRGDFFSGNEWYRFLLQCKYTMGVEGGASLLDPDGSIHERCVKYLDGHPGATFQELEAACFPNMDGSLHLRALSPRHLEACATRTCQILMEGEYNGVLKPGRHYIELKEDFSNVDQILELIRQDHLRKEITEQAYHDIVESRRFTYRSFVEFVLQSALGNPPPRSGPVRFGLVSRAIYWWNRAAENVSWFTSLFWLKRLLPPGAKSALRGVLRRPWRDPFARA